MPAETLIDAKPVSRNEYVHRLTDKTILVTGAGGYLGTAFLSSLYRIRCRIVALVHQRKCASIPSDNEASLVSRSVDLSQRSVWVDLIRGTRPDVIVHLAAHEHHRNSRHAPELDLAVNTATVLELLEACRELNLKPRIILASSANIVGFPTSSLVNEDTPDQPLTLYAINKLVAERYLRYYAETFGLPGVSLRFANIYGPLPGADPDLESRVVLNNIMRRALDGGPLYLYRNQHCVRDFVYVDDAVRAICAAATTETFTPGCKFIVGSGEGHSLKEIINGIAGQVEHLGHPSVEVLFDAKAMLEPVEWREFVADYRRLRAATSWEPLTTLHQGIAATLRAFIGDGGRLCAEKYH